MRRTQTHLFFFNGLFSNWAQTPLDGKVALREMIERLDTAGIAHPPEGVEISGRLKGRFKCVEQWMMASKAWLMGDIETMKAILAAASPKDQKALGRRVKPFDTRLWDAAAPHIVTAGLIAKFTSTPRMEDEILDTGDLVLVEASPYDRIWGIGLDANHPDADNPLKWRGKNLLGKCLMEARQVIAERRYGAATTQ